MAIPARAGVILRHGSRHTGGCCPPRTRGGSTRGLGAVLPSRPICPHRRACAAIDRGAMFPGERSTHVSWSGPAGDLAGTGTRGSAAVHRAGHPAGSDAPHARGCTRERRRQGQGHAVSPARAGVNRGECSVILGRTSFPARAGVARTKGFSCWSSTRRPAPAGDAPTSPAIWRHAPEQTGSPDRVPARAGMHHAGRLRANPSTPRTTWPIAATSVGNSITTCPRDNGNVSRNPSGNEIRYAMVDTAQA